MELYKIRRLSFYAPWIGILAVLIIGGMGLERWFVVETSIIEINPITLFLGIGILTALLAIHYLALRGEAVRDHFGYILMMWTMSSFISVPFMMDLAKWVRGTAYFFIFLGIEGIFFPNWPKAVIDWIKAKLKRKVAV